MRDADINAERASLGEVEEFLAAAGRDKLAQVGAARGDGPGERRGDMGEGLEFLQAMDVRAGGLDGRRFEREIGLLLGRFLRADALGLDEFGPSRGGDFGKGQRGFGLSELSAGLGQFLV